MNTLERITKQVHFPPLDNSRDQCRSYEQYQKQVIEYVHALIIKASDNKLTKISRAISQTSFPYPQTASRHLVEKLHKKNQYLKKVRSEGKIIEFLQGTQVLVTMTLADRISSAYENNVLVFDRNCDEDMQTVVESAFTKYKIPYISVSVPQDD